MLSILSASSVYVTPGNGTEIIRQYYDRTIQSWWVTGDQALRLAILGYAIRRHENWQQPNNYRGVTYGRNSAQYCVRTSRSRYCSFNSPREWYLARLNVRVAGGFSVDRLCTSAARYKYGSNWKIKNCAKDNRVRNVYKFLDYYQSSYVIPDTQAISRVGIVSQSGYSAARDVADQPWK